VESTIVGVRDVPSGERKRRTVSLGLCATQWVARLRLREYIERTGVCSKRRLQQIPVPGTTFRQQAEWWMESLSMRRRRPVKPATVYGWRIASTDGFSLTLPTS
jgi:hypothetical protein